MGLQDWSAVRSDGGSFANEEESTFWRWGKKLSPWLVIAIALYAAFSYLVNNELHEIELKLNTHSIAIQHMQKDMNTLKQDVVILKKDLNDVKVSLAKIEGYLIQQLNAQPTP